MHQTANSQLNGMLFVADCCIVCANWPINVVAINEVTFEQRLGSPKPQP